MDFPLKYISNPVISPSLRPLNSSKHQYHSLEHCKSLLIDFFLLTLASLPVYFYLATKAIATPLNWIIINLLKNLSLSTTLKATCKILKMACRPYMVYSLLLLLAHLAPCSTPSVFHPNHMAWFHFLSFFIHSFFPPKNLSLSILAVAGL